MDAEVAECDYISKGWPKGTRTICRRVKVTPAELSADPRSRRRRTIDPNQLTLLTSGEADYAYAYAYSFIITNLSGDIVDIEAWFRMRALVEEKIKDSKLGLAMRHMPSGYEAVNVMWMWAALLGLNISSWLRALTGHDQADGRAHGKRLRRELVCIAARVTNHAGRLEAHPSPEDHHGYFGDAWRTLDVLIAGTSP
jgi:ABC-type molybdate transport system substrate-binding protein